MDGLLTLVSLGICSQTFRVDSKPSVHPVADTFVEGASGLRDMLGLEACAVVGTLCVVGTTSSKLARDTD